MKRSEALNVTMSKEVDVKVLTKAIIEKDERFLKRHIRDLEDKVEDLQVELDKRLSSDIPLDKAALELYNQIIKLEKSIETTECFQQKYL